ncbi:hypothetical protein VNO77_00955 [Canavalia gladiata]|uniref:Uncharacterized protein n=1 Tax=Canavalia gladiata TaxID=3824 RepID=A0AAN9MR21_CANGL
MKRSELGVGGRCKEHPNEKQLPGVCSSCLRDKLSKLCKNKATYPLPRSPPSSSSPQHLSSTLNYESQAYRRRHRHHRHTSNVTDSVSSMINYSYGLKKSNSIAFASRSLAMDRETDGNNRRSKKGSFWSKILQLTRKNTKVAFMHSRITREGNS